ncbi:hypothetical protein PHMEG_00011998 [Phytophthora megakarya]|uniref:Uncharacterized protein n=1 Tax=Phytophthora megakarya TaxID=4795 RepID=A0A225WA64_9STRA|nr:hypothetical protein PHMEG_00011998 [Phytophthora megakarya]
MQAGFGFSLAVQMMGDNAVAHHEFPENKLHEMPMQMMCHRCLENTPWTQHVPDRYYKTAEVTLRTHRRNLPPEWPMLRNVRNDSFTAHQGINVADSEEVDDPKDEDYNSQEDASELAADDDKEGSRSGEDDSKAKYPDLFSSSDESGEEEKPKQNTPSKHGSLSPISSSGDGNYGKKPKRRVSAKPKRRSCGGSSGSEWEHISGTYTPSPERPRPREKTEWIKFREIKVADRGIVSWRRRGILTRFFSNKDGSNLQTPAFPDYAPQMNELGFLKQV